MINRVLIRIKTAQVLYAQSMGEELNPSYAARELQRSFDNTYGLYISLLWLPVTITDFVAKKLESGKGKYLPSEADLNPNTRFIDNQYIALVRNNGPLQKELSKISFSWEEEEGYVKDLTRQILESELYRNYMQDQEVSFAKDQQFWRLLYKEFIASQSSLVEAIESGSIYWNDDEEIVSDFVIKTIRRADPEKGENRLLIPPFKDSEDDDFGFKLLRYAIDHREELLQVIVGNVTNWDPERVGVMEKVILLLAVSEFLLFPEIPLSVTINEYIEMAKHYGAKNSGRFINGVLDQVVNQLKKDKKLLK